MPIHVIIRKDTGSITLDGYVNERRYRRRAQSDNPKLAKEEAAAWEAEILRTAWHGERRGARSFAESALSYLGAEPRSDNQKAIVRRLVDQIGAKPLAEVNQDLAVELKGKMLQPGAAPGTYRSAIITPMRAILNYAHGLGWCEHAAGFVVPGDNPGRIFYLLPDEAERLIVCAAPHLKPLLTFLLCTGARMAEAIELDWQDVDLVGARAIFWKTKGGPRRNAHLPPRVVGALANLPHREGPVFRRSGRRRRDGQITWTAPYTDRGRRYGGQIKTGWQVALRDAGLNPELTPHDLRHTWASWHYALHRDAIRLQAEGGWSSITLVTRYAHLLPAGHETAIQTFLGHVVVTSQQQEQVTA
jgi:integrase